MTTKVVIHLDGDYIINLHLEGRLQKCDVNHILTISFKEWRNQIINFDIKYI